jgi:hypothetical protein
MEQVLDPAPDDLGATDGADGRAEVLNDPQDPYENARSTPHERRTT